MSSAPHFFGSDPEKLAVSLESLARDIRELAAGSPPVLQGVPVLTGFELVPKMIAALSGTVSGHPTLGTGREVITSEIYAMGLDASWVRTFSRFYVLRPSDDLDG